MHVCVEQAYLQTRAARLEHLEKGQEIELWLGFRSLPQSLKDRFRQHQKYNWEENKAIDADKHLNKLPRDLARAIRKHHCVSLYKVSTFFLAPMQLFLAPKGRRCACVSFCALTYFWLGTNT